MDRILPTELQLNRANSSDTESPFLDLNLCISNGTVSAKIYDRRDDFDFDVVNFPFPDDDVPRHTSYGVYISQLIRFTTTSSDLEKSVGKSNFSEQFRKLISRYERLAITWTLCSRLHA